MLIRGAYSSNIKERRDCSAALFDAEGRMVAQAEHIPVHLGAMPESVAAVIERGPQPGEVWILNDPYRGGTHLPDITLVSPMEVDGEVLGFAVTRAHHSDVGGMRPGSMPSDSREIWQEGLVIPPVRLVRDGELRPGAARAAAGQRAHAGHPPRRPARADRRQPPGRDAAARAGGAPRPRGRRRRVLRGARLRRAAHARGDRRATRRALRGARRDRGRRRLRRGHPDRRGRRDRRRDAADRLRGHAPARSPATSTARSRSRVRRATSRCACSLPGDVPANAGTYAAVEIERARGLARRTPRRPPPWSPATSRRRSGSPTPSWPRWPRRSSSPPPGRAR